MTDQTRQDAGEVVVPLSQEELTLETRQVETGQVRVRTIVEDEAVTLDEDLLRETVEVERLAINQPIERAPAIREEGDVLIVPVVEERLVVEKRLFLVEEVRLRRRAARESVEIPVTRRVMRAEITRETPDSKD